MLYDHEKFEYLLKFDDSLDKQSPDLDVENLWEKNVDNFRISFEGQRIVETCKRQATPEQDLSSMAKMIPS